MQNAAHALVQLLASLRDPDTGRVGGAQLRCAALHAAALCCAVLRCTVLTVCCNACALRVAAAWPLRDPDTMPWHS